MILNEDNFKRLIDNNAHIRKLSVYINARSNVLKMLRFIAVNLPSLESLELREYRERDEKDRNVTVHFNSLKKLIVRSNYLDLPSKVTYEQLEELEIDALCLENNHRRMDLIRNQRSLKKLTIKQNLKASDIRMIANSNSSLVEISFMCGCYEMRQGMNMSQDEIPYCECDATVESIVELLENSTHLQRLHVYSGWAATNSVFEALQNLSPIEWTVTRETDDQGGECVHFERW